jgi:hypothetical protein
MRRTFVITKLDRPSLRVQWCANFATGAEWAADRTDSLHWSRASSDLRFAASRLAHARDKGADTVVPLRIGSEATAELKCRRSGLHLLKCGTKGDGPDRQDLGPTEST